MSPLAASRPSLCEGILGESVTELSKRSCSSWCLFLDISRMVFQLCPLPVPVSLRPLHLLLSIPQFIHHLHQFPSTGRVTSTFLWDFLWLFLFPCTTFFFFSVLMSRSSVFFFFFFILNQFSLLWCEFSSSFFKQIWGLKEVVFLVSSCDYTNIHSPFTHCWGSVTCRRTRRRWNTVVQILSDSW